MPDFQFYKYEVNGPLATVTINNPSKFNVMGEGPWREMQAIQDLIEDTADVRVVIIKAAGPHFSAGINLSELLSIDAKFVSKNISWLQRTYNRWQDLNAISIAAVQGFCYGSAFEMCTCFDIRVASEDAKFAIPEVRFGLSPDMGASQRLPRLVGPGQAKRLILACEEIDAKEAKEIGLVEIVVPLEELYPRTEKLAKAIINKPPWAVRFGKKAINISQDCSIGGGLLFEQVQSCFCCNTEDQNEAVNAFFEKRKPVFHEE
ncbi:MAG: enoyl-CoA hydratase/isomerase family protein [Methylocystaceae bacterium]